MRLLSLHAGQPETLQGYAGPFLTAIRKVATAGPVAVGPLGLDGDAVGDTESHGGPDAALLAFGVGNYAAWEAELGPNDAFASGGFGENLSVEGVDEDGVSVGDVWAIGPVRLEVSMPRMPCNTLAQRVGARDLVKRAVASGRTGWYLRVLEPGVLEPGSQIEVLDRPTVGWTIRRSLTVMAHARAPVAEAEGLAACPALPARWRERLLGRNGGE